MKPDLSLYLVTERSLSLSREIEWIVEQAVQGGVTAVQLREKHCSDGEFKALASSIKKITSPYGVPLIINDRIEVALAIDADGIHVGQSDIAPIEARKLLGKEKIIGLSVENMSQTEEANGLDIDYIGISPVFSTDTKKDIAPPFGLEGVRNVSKISRHPAVAIGGINLSNAGEVIESGADGIAVVSAICSSKNPKKSAMELRFIVDSILKKRNNRH